MNVIIDPAINAISHSIGAISYFALSLYLLTTVIKKASSRMLFFASLIMACWSLTIAIDSFSPTLDLSLFSNTLEILKDAAWLAVVIKILGLSSEHSSEQKKHIYLSYSAIGLVITLLIMTLTQPFLTPYSALHTFNEEFTIVGYMFISICGVMLVEQVLRSSLESSLWHVKFFCLSLAAIFGYDFIMYSHGILVAGVEPQLWQARGIVTAILAPLIALGAARNFNQTIKINLSHSVAFHTGALLIIGIYLVVMSIAGYYIRSFGGNWGGVLQTLLIFSSLVGLLIVGTSGSMRAKLAVYVARNFFRYKYDYRDEWISLTNKLSRPDNYQTTYEQAIRCIADVVKSTGGGLWLEENNQFNYIESANINLETAPNITKDSSLTSFLESKDWIIDIPDYKANPSKYEGLELNPWFIENERAWLIIPLMLQNQLLGFLLLTNPRTPIQLNWEDIDLLKVIARQVASFLAQRQAGEALSRAKQFEAVNQMTAFLVHDLKTMIAQLSLMVSNAEKHKSNPVFIDDMIKTTAHSVKKMNHILQKLQIQKEDIQNSEPHNNEPTLKDQINISELLTSTVNAKVQNQPQPQFSDCDKAVFILGDREKLSSAVGHIIQNAQDATENDGFVKITVENINKQVKILIEDNGTGMDMDFIKHHLFHPFHSTKGLTGMGIGVFQSRAYCREMGGDLTVTSEQGKGSCFCITLPLAES